jgi:hypothetical protein
VPLSRASSGIRLQRSRCMSTVTFSISMLMPIAPGHCWRPASGQHWSRCSQRRRGRASARPETGCAPPRAHLALTPDA